MALPPVVALSRTLALRFAPDSEFWAGSTLNLTTSPSAIATGRTVQGTDPTSAQALAFGLGAGASRYYATPENSAYFNSPNLAIVSGGGLIQGNAVATAFASGRGDTNADAQAINVGLATVGYLARFNGKLEIGTSANPFTASATAGSDSALAPLASTPPPLTSLNAYALVRGLEGNGVSQTPVFYGQPNAAVAADATLNFSGWPIGTKATASADAKGLEGYTIAAALAGDGTGQATISGDATARLALKGSPAGPLQQLDLNGHAIGIDHSLIFGAPTLNTTVSGLGLALLDASQTGLTPAQVNLGSLQGIGILASEIHTNRGNDLVVGRGGYADSGFNQGTPGLRDAAGIDQSIIHTGTGSDTIYGAILNEQDLNLDVNGDGSIQATTFLDVSARNPLGQGGFDGIRDSSVNTGLDGDTILGSSHHSSLATSLGNDRIELSRSKGSNLDGGQGNDVIQVDELGLDNSLFGDFGNDLLAVAAGDGNRLDGGFGQDLSTGGTGQDQFVQSNAGAAYQAASSDDFARVLTDEQFWNGLSAQQKNDLWSSGHYVVGGQTLGSVDTMANFVAGSPGDTLELSASLASISQSLWTSSATALFDVVGGNLHVLEGGTNTKLGVVVDSLAEIKSLGIGAPSIAYATDTHQLMFDADGDWKQGSISLGTVNMTTASDLKKSNFAFA